MIKEAIAKVVERIDLEEHEMSDVVEMMMEGEATPGQISAFLVALRMKGESVSEITGAAKVMLDKAIRIHSRHEVIVDLCGTGGDRQGTFNVSTAAAFVVAGAGVPVAKHGNRSVSSYVGSADVLGLLARKVLVGLGNDGFGSNLLDDLKAAYLLQKHAHGDPKALGMGQAHQIFFDNNYRIAKRFFGAKLGKVSPGYQADLILVEYDPPTPLHASNVMGHFLFGLCSRFDVVSAFVKGKLVMQDRQVLGVDLERAYANARQQAKALWKRIV